MRPDERLFIEAIRDLNRQASRLQAEENQSIFAQNEHISNCTGTITTTTKCDTITDIDLRGTGQFVGTAQTIGNSGEKLSTSKPANTSLSPI